jgi:uncharacterized membrane protein YfcA
MVGIGGGLVIVPALVFFFGMDQKMAQGTSLMIITLPVTAMGAYTYWKNGNASIPSSIYVALTFLVGGYLGGVLANKMDTNTVRKIFAVFMIAVSIKMLFFDKPRPKPQRPTPSSTESNSPLRH